MKYYKTWQEAFISFTERYGHNFDDSYNLAAEFEEHLYKNKNGTYYFKDTIL
jgi:hypothetical protein